MQTKKNRYKEYIIKILSETPLLSNEITNKLMKEFKISRYYSRKILHDSKDNTMIFSSYPLRFDNGQLAYSTVSGNNTYIKVLNNKPRLYNVYMKFLRNNHYISKLDILKLSGALNLSDSKYYDFAKVINDLKYFIPHIKTIEYNTDVFYYDSKKHINFDEKYNELLNLRYFELLIFPTILNFCHRLKLTTKNPFYITKSAPFTPVFTRQHLAFDAFSWTKIGNANKESTIVVFDIKIGDNYNFEDFFGFKTRVDTLIYSTKKWNQRVIPIIVTRNFEHMAYKMVSEDKTFLMFTLNNIFGSKINEFLEKFYGQSEFRTINQIEESIKLLESTGLTSLLYNFMPDIFESMVQELITMFLSKKSRMYDSMLRSKKVGINEYDIFYESNDEIFAVECKFHRKNKIVWESLTSRGELKNDCGRYFFEKKYDVLRENYPNKKIKMLFVAANGFYDNLSKFSNEKRDEVKHELFNDVIIDGQDLVDIIKANNISIPFSAKVLSNFFIS